MGPVLIFDKSFLQSLNPDESAWLDHFFLTNITPIFYVETLADLEKEIRNGRTPEQVVGNLAYKTPDSKSKPNVHHLTLLTAELDGQWIDMRFGRPIIAGAKKVQRKNKTGFIVPPSPEEEALSRWGQEQFIELERSLAANWRAALNAVDNEQLYRNARELVEKKGKPKTLSQAKDFAITLLKEADQEALLITGMKIFGISEDIQENALVRWRRSQRSSITEVFPYLGYLLTVEYFFYVAVGCDLISKDRASHKVDLAYLYYLPFCMVFTSNDKLHLQIVPLFLNPQQTCFQGTDLKADLTKLDAYYSTFPPEVKNQGMYKFASQPPLDQDFLISKLWRKYMNVTGIATLDHDAAPTEEQAEIVSCLNEFQREAISSSSDFDADESDVIIIERSVLLQKGKWRRFPPEVN